jgi:hypothetical protein
VESTPHRVLQELGPLRIADDFIGNTDIADEVKASTDFFPQVTLDDDVGKSLNGYHNEQASCYAPFMFWDGWWNSPADTLRKQVIQHIWEPIIPEPEKNVLGFEYWLRTMIPGQFHGRHFDFDTFLYEDSQRLQGPSIGCVWYGFSKGEGSYLELHEDGLAEGVVSVKPEALDAIASPPSSRERIAHRPDRLIIFDPGHRLHETTKLVSGIKQVLAVNVWATGTMPHALSTGQFVFETTP